MTDQRIWERDMPKQLAVTLATISNVSDMQRILRDLLTEKEILEVSARLQAATMLKGGQKYAEIAKTTELSSRTIARISEWLKSGEGGYEIAIRAINSHHPHTTPGRD